MDPGRKIAIYVVSLTTIALAASGGGEGGNGGDTTPALSNAAGVIDGHVSMRRFPSVSIS